LPAQGRERGGFIIEGNIIREDSKESLPNAYIVIRELNIWEYSNENGLFRFEKISKGVYTLDIFSLGYVARSIKLEISGNIESLIIEVKEDNLEIEEVIVTAETGKAINTSSVIGTTAIRHLQPSSLTDIMQLLPGSLTSNPTLTSKNDITIRSIYDPGNNNARGVALLINGSRVSNEASIMVERTSELFNTLDYRKFSTDNIESVEVLKGILSAEYGDVTAGAVLVKTKAGRTPFEIRVKADPRTKAISFSKGFYLGNESGNLNIDADYARAYKDARSPVDIYNRATLGLTYSNTFIRGSSPLRFNAYLSGYLVGNNSLIDPDVSMRDFTKRREANLSLTMYGNWQLKRSWITSLNYNFSGRVGREDYQKYSVNNGLPLPTTERKTSGIAEGWYTGELDEFDRRNEDIPLYLSGKLSAHLNKEVGSSLFKSVLGFEFNSKGNNGRGTYYNGSSPQYFRERNYYEIPYMNDLSLFAEERVNGKLLNRDYQVSAGVRFTKMLIKGYSYAPVVDPRTNFNYSILPNNNSRFIRSLSIRGGWGLLHKLPSLGLLYPSPIYIDNPLFQYRNSSTGESLVVISTEVVDNRLQYELEPARSRNIELGVDFSISETNVRITWFNEKLSNGITDNYSYVTSSYDYYNSVSNPDSAPIFRDGRVWVKDENGEYIELGYTTHNEFKQYSTPDNRGETKKWGIEYEVDFGRIKALNTSVLLTGSYIHQLESSPGLRREYISNVDPINTREKFPYVGIYESKSNFLTIGDGNRRFTSTLHLVTNIPSLRLVVSLIGQCIWMNERWNIYDKERVYKLDSEGNRVFGDWGDMRNEEIMYRDPDFYLDFSGNVRPFSDYYTTSDADLRRRLQTLILSSNQPYYFQKSGYRPYFMANLRVTKEIGDIASLSFYANNFTNSRPILKLNTRPDAPGSRVNTDIYFGAELKLTF
jgi:hypothetical protein